MTWSNTWDDILSGGNPRWKVDDVKAKEAALNHIETHAGDDRKLKIFCPLAGDDGFVKSAWSQGHDVTAIDLVPAAVAAMRKQFGSDDEWIASASAGAICWKHNSKRATLYEGDALQSHQELHESFDAVYDKDSFGALDKSMRSAFCERLAEYTKPGGIVYVEVKNKPEGPARLQGPPFHVESEDLMEKSSFGKAFEYVTGLGQVYELSSIPGMSQMGHILRRVTN